MKKDRLFNLIVKRLGFLKAVPFLPHVFDAGLKLCQVITHSGLPDYIDSIEAEVKTWDNTSISLHKYGGLQFNYKGKEMGHVHSNGLLDIRFSKAIKASLLAENRITDHHVFANSGWISFYIRNADDTEYAKSLLKTAYLMKL